MKTLFSWLVVFVFLLTAGTGCTGESNAWDDGDDWGTNQRDDRDKDDRSRDRNRNSNSNSNSNRNDSDSPGDEIGQAFEELGNALEGLSDAFNNETNVEPVDFRELGEVIPERIRGMEAGKSSGERTGALGFRVSQIEQTFYEENGDGKVEISVVDLGGLKNLAAMGLDWLNLDVDREGTDGYERTRTYRDHPVLDKCDSRSRYDVCEMIAFVSRRFVVTLRSTDMEMGMLEDVMEKMDIRKLERMKEDGVMQEG